VEIQVHATVACHHSASSPSSTGSSSSKKGKRAKAWAAAGAATGEGTPLLEVHTTYVVYGSGDVRVKISAASLYGPKQRQAPLHFPRIGLALALPKAFSEATWLGLGPHENYADRKTGARLGVHAATVEELHTPYVVPSAWGSVGLVDGSECLG
jgi:beta-galactosidase/beta-glucuronidase